MTKILLIDDDTFVLESLSAVLEANDYQTEKLVSLNDASKKLSALGGYDLVLLDIWLLDGSGLPFLQKIKAARADIPVIIISGGGPGKTLEQAVAFADAGGADAVLIKPVQNDELLTAVSNALNR